MQLAVRLIGFIEPIGFRDVSVYLLSYRQASFVGPQPRHVVDCISSSAQEHQRNSIRHHFLDAFPMPFDRKIQSAKHIISNWVSPQLKHHCSWPILSHDFVHNLFENLLIIFIINANFQRNIQGIVLPFSLSYCVYTACSWKEVISILMEADRHNPICEVKCFFNSIAVVHVYVEIEHSCMIFQQLQNS